MEDAACISNMKNVHQLPPNLLLESITFSFQHLSHPLLLFIINEMLHTLCLPMYAVVRISLLYSPQHTTSSYRPSKQKIVGPEGEL